MSSEKQQNDSSLSIVDTKLLFQMYEQEGKLITALYNETFSSSEIYEEEIMKKMDILHTNIKNYSKFLANKLDKLKSGIRKISINIAEKPH